MGIKVAGLEKWFILECNRGKELVVENNLSSSGFGFLPYLYKGCKIEQSVEKNKNTLDNSLCVYTIKRE